MIVRRKTLEQRIEETGLHAIRICYDTIKKFDDIPCSSYSTILTAGYRALNHRKSRLLKWYDLHKPCVMTDYCVHNVETYVINMMSKEANKQIFKPIPNPYEKRNRFFRWVNGFTTRR